MASRDGDGAGPDETQVLPERAPLPSDELSSGARIGEYVVQSQLARGGCGTVYVGTHRTLGRRAAIKVLHRELARVPIMVERFHREARAVNMIRDDHIADVFELGQLDDGRPYMIMELLEGETLQALIERQGPMSVAEICEVVAPICSALGAAHRVGIIHRDLKASNVFVTTVAGQRMIKLLDFGIAKLTQADADTPQLTQVGSRLGTPIAMAPEQIRGQAVDPRTDVYALGVLIYFLLVGRPPFTAPTAAEVERKQLEDPPPRPSAAAALPLPIDDVVLGCLSKLPDQRYPSAAAVLAALKLACGHAPRRAGARTARAIGVYVTVKITHDSDDPDDEVLDELDRHLERAAIALREAGLAIIVEAGAALLGVTPLGDDDERSARGQQLTAAARLAASMPPIAGAGWSVSTLICVHVDQALIRGDVVAGGPLLDMAAWVPSDHRVGAWATAGAVADIVSIPAGERMIQIQASHP